VNLRLLVTDTHRSHVVVEHIVYLVNFRLLVRRYTEAMRVFNGLVGLILMFHHYMHGFCVYGNLKFTTAVLGNLAKISMPIFAHARNFPFNLNMNFRTCANFPETAT
jgi:hypothetical protein